MSFLSRLFGSQAKAREQAVIVHLDGQGLPAEVDDEFDLATIEDQLIDVIATHEVGEFDGNEVGQEGATLFMYGPDAERLFAAIESTLRAYPLCKGARVVVRRGPPGAAERSVILA